MTARLPHQMRASLAQYIEGLGPFDWAAANCCHYVAGWFVANGQPDPMVGIRSTPTLLAARRLVAEGGGIVGLITERLGRESIPAALAQVGDIVHFHLDGAGFTLGICNGIVSVCIDEEGAAVFLPTLRGSCAWRLKP